MTDRVVIPFGSNWLVLSEEAFNAALQDGTAFAGESRARDTNATAGTGQAVARLLLCAEDAARALAIDASWLLRKAREGRVPHVRLGRHVRFDPAAIIGLCTTPATLVQGTRQPRLRR